MENFFVYKLNKFEKNLFKLNKFEDINDYLVFTNFNEVDNNVFYSLLSKKRKIVIHDSTIINIEKLKNLLVTFYRNNEDFYLSNLFISKECFVEFPDYNNFFNLCKEIEFLNNEDKNKIIKSDDQLNCSIKIKDIENLQTIGEKLDKSIFLKNIILEQFHLEKININKVINQLIGFYKLIKDNLIYSTSFLVEKDIAKQSFFHFVKSDENNLKVMDSKKIGIISAIDYDCSTFAKIDNESKKLMNLSVENVGWIDLVELKNKVMNFNIEYLIIEDIEKYNNLEKINVCAKYIINDKIVTGILPNKENLKKVYPLYLKFDGWKRNLDEINDENNIPDQLINFIKEIKKLLKLKSIKIRLTNFEIAV